MQGMDPDSYYRLFAFVQSLKLLVEHPLTGSGPGMFGGLASILWNSPVYDTWPVYFRDMAFRIRSIDAFWPVVWGEYGMIGMTIYCAGWISLFRYLGKACVNFKNNGAQDLYNIGRVLQYFIIALIIMGFAGGLNSAFVVYTYFALVGIFISIYQRSAEQNDQLGHNIPNN